MPIDFEYEKKCGGHPGPASALPTAPVENAIDGYTSTSWQTDTAVPQWFYVFSKPKVINRVVLQISGHNKVKSVSVKVPKHETSSRNLFSEILHVTVTEQIPELVLDIPSENAGLNKKYIIKIERTNAFDKEIKDWIGIEEVTFYEGSHHSFGQL